MDKDYFEQLAAREEAHKLSETLGLRAYCEKQI
jgi:hypothetical protein